MPITLPPISRRRFLVGAVAAGAAVGLRGRWGWGAEAGRDANRLALLSDTHIDADAMKINREVNMTDHLRIVVERLRAMAKEDGAPSAVLVNGDLAFLKGEAADYAAFAGLVRPLREAGWPLHLSMGNHDHRERFWAGVGQDQSPGPVEQKHVMTFEMPAADWVILDSLEKTNSTPGVLGEAQLAWLAKVLDGKSDKPAVVMVHHNPELSRLVDAATTQPAKVNGLTDTRALFDVLMPRKRVKALVYGHSHRWACAKHDGLHLINLPAVSYAFGKEPAGWVDCRMQAGGMRLELRCVDESDPRNGEVVEAGWR